MTGGSGFLGAEVVRLAVARPGVDEVVATHHRHPGRVPVLDGPGGAAVRPVAADLRDTDAVRALIGRIRPDAVIHTAYVESGPDLESVTAEAPGVVAAAARVVGSRTVFVSTDVVFAGDRPDGEVYVEDDIVAPVHDYGRAKASAEGRVLAADADAVVVRTSLLYAGTRRPPPPLGRHEQVVLDVLDGHRDMAFFTDEWRAPITVTDLAAVLIALAVTPDRSVAGVHHVAGPEAVTHHDFACRLAASWGRDPGAVPGALSGSAAGPRPRCCVIAATRPLPPGARPPRSVTEVLGPSPSKSVTG